MLLALALVGGGFLSAIGWYGANAYVIDPYLKQIPAPPPAVVPKPEAPKAKTDDTK
jgi:hypothetical protein